MEYPAVYAGLILFGGLIGTLVTFLLPQVPLTPVERALSRLRTALVENLERLAAGLETDDLPDRDHWRRRTMPLDHWIWTTHRTRQEAEESRRWNLRAAQWRTRLTRASRQARAFERAAWMVQDLGEVISGDESSGTDVVGLGPALRPQTVTVLRAVAETMDSLGENGIDADRLAAAGRALDGFAERVGTERTPSQDGFHVASNVVNSVRRILLLLRDLTPTSADQVAQPGTRSDDPASDDHLEPRGRRVEDDG